MKKTFCVCKSVSHRCLAAVAAAHRVPPQLAYFPFPSDAGVVKHAWFLPVHVRMMIAVLNVLYTSLQSPLDTCSN